MVTFGLPWGYEMVTEITDRVRPPERYFSFEDFLGNESRKTCKGMQNDG